MISLVLRFPNAPNKLDTTVRRIAKYIGPSCTITRCPVRRKSVGSFRRLISLAVLRILCGHSPSVFAAQLVQKLSVERDAATGRERVTWKPWTR